MNVKDSIAKDLSDVVRDSLLSAKGSDCLSQLYATSKALAEVLQFNGLIADKARFVSDCLGQ